MNRDLMLRNLGGGEIVIPEGATHLVTVESVSSGYLGYHLASSVFGQSFGSILPSNHFTCFAYDGVYEYELSSLFCSIPLGSNGQTMIIANFIDYAWEDLVFYIGRKDSGLVYCSTDLSEEYYDPELGEVMIPNILLFSEQDIGKQIPIWLSSEKPPF